MGRGKRFHYAKYVKYDKTSNISECLLCKRQMKALSTGNIKRHYLKVHQTNLDADLDSTEMTPKKPTMKVKLGMNKNEFLTCCIGLVSMKNIPFGIFDDELYFKKLIAPYEDEFQTNLNSENMQKHLSGAVVELRSVISEEIRNRMVCLKLEMVTRAGRCVLVVNIQYMDNFNIISQTIGVIELHKNNNSKYLKSGIMKCLSECGIANSQIYSVTTDKGSNVYLQELQEHGDVDSDSAWEKEYESIHYCFSDVVKCATNNVHLAANDVIQSIEENIAEYRTAVQRLGTMFRKTEVPIPPVDSSGRWLPTYSMIESLLNLKTNIEDVEENVEFNWDFAVEFIAAFKPLAECIKKANDLNYIIGDFYRDWLCCEIELEEISDRNIYADLLLRQMNARKDKLLDNETFLAALYIDPRFNFIKTPFINAEQKQKATHFLLKTVGYLKGIEENDDLSSNDGERTSFHASSSLNPFCKLEEKTMIMIGSATAAPGKTIAERLESQRYCERLTFDTDILNHWRCLTYEDAEMRRLLEVVLASPCTEVSVERTVREFSTILANPKCSLPNKTINNILMIRLNSNILRDVNLDAGTCDDVEMK